MVTQFVDTVAGTPVYINPTYVVSVRPDPADPDAASIVKLSDGETLRVRGSHQQVADRLTRTAA
jgi:uncharacterized protein YlzI (FlbEa/FlbD family)